MRQIEGSQREESLYEMIVMNRMDENEKKRKDAYSPSSSPLHYSRPFSVDQNCSPLFRYPKKVSLLISLLFEAPPFLDAQQCKTFSLLLFETIAFLHIFGCWDTERLFILPFPLSPSFFASFQSSIHGSLRKIRRNPSKFVIISFRSH